MLASKFLSTDKTNKSCDLCSVIPCLCPMCGTSYCITASDLTLLNYAVNGSNSILISPSKIINACETGPVIFVTSNEIKSSSLYFACTGKYIVTMTCNVKVSLPDEILISAMQVNPINNIVCGNTMFITSPEAEGVNKLMLSCSGNIVRSETGSDISYTQMLTVKCCQITPSILIGLRFTFDLENVPTQNINIVSFQTAYTICVTYVGP